MTDPSSAPAILQVALLLLSAFSTGFAVGYAVAHPASYDNYTPSRAPAGGTGGRGRRWRGDPGGGSGDGPGPPEPEPSPPAAPPASDWSIVASRDAGPPPTPTVYRDPRDPRIVRRRPRPGETNIREDLIPLVGLLLRPPPDHEEWFAVLVADCTLIQTHGEELPDGRLRAYREETGDRHRLVTTYERHQWVRVTAYRRH